MCLKEKDREGLLRQLQALAQQKVFQNAYPPSLCSRSHRHSLKAVKTPYLPVLPTHVSTKISFLPAVIMTR